MANSKIVSNKQVQIEIELIINKKLYNKKIIDRQTYEDVNNELLRDINKELEKI